MTDRVVTEGIPEGVVWLIKNTKSLQPLFWQKMPKYDSLENIWKDVEAAMRGFPRSGPLNLTDDPFAQTKERFARRMVWC